MNIPDKFRHQIQNIEVDNFYKVFNHVVMTVYMTSKMDPIHHHLFDNKKRDTDNYEYIKPLYESCKKFNKHLIIFHDNLSDEFIEKYQTDKIIFRQVFLNGGFTINDERYVIYYEYLLKNPYYKILTSDVSDVYLNSDPFNLFNLFEKPDNNLMLRDGEKKIELQDIDEREEEQFNYSKEEEALNIINNEIKLSQSSFSYLEKLKLTIPERDRILYTYVKSRVSNQEKIFVGTNSIGAGYKSKTPRWFERRQIKIDRFNLALEKFGNGKYPPFTCGEFQIFNPGTIMASYNKYLEYIEKFLEIMFVVANERENMNWNMVINTYLIVNYYFDDYCPNTFCSNQIWSGQPFNSIYQKNEKIGESNCCLIHK